MSQIAYTVVHATVQVVTGLVAGTAIDAVFPAPPSSSGVESAVDAGEVLAEVVLQCIAGGLLASAFHRLMANLPYYQQDTSMGFAFFLAMIESQPNLRKKVCDLSTYARTEITGGVATFEKEMGTTYPRNKAHQNFKLGELRA